MPSSASPSATVFRACVVNAVKDGEALMQKLVRCTRAHLADAEPRTAGIQQRTDIADAVRLLDKHEAALLKSYPMALLEIFAEGPSTSKARPSVDSGMDFGELTLVDDTEVMAQVELSRAQQIASHATDAALSELNTYVSSAQGLRNVQPERNPFRPENYIRALQRCVDACDVSAMTRQLWMQHMREELGMELIASYQRVTRSLKEHGVQPVGYTVAPAPGGMRHGGLAGGSAEHSGYSGHSGHATHSGYSAGRASRSDGTAEHGFPPSRQGVGDGLAGSSHWQGAPADAQEAALTVNILRQMLAAGGDPFGLDPARPRPDAGVSLPMVPPGMQGGFMPSQVSEAMEDMAQLERLVGRLAQSSAGKGGGQPASARPVSSGSSNLTLLQGMSIPMSMPMPMGGAGAIGPSNWQQMSVPAGLGSNYGTLTSRSATEVLSRMMDNIAQDSRLLAPVQRAVQNLEPALKQLVRQDPSFFSNEQHPARKLLDALTQRSLSFKDETSRGFQKYIQLVNAAVQHLSTMAVHDAKAFEHVSDALESAWNTQVQQLQRQQSDEHRRVEKEDQREMLAPLWAQRFRQLPQVRGAAEDMVDFVMGVWAQVAARAQIDAQERGGELDEQHDYLTVVPVLLDCAQAEHSRGHAQRLKPLLDGMLSTIRDGLLSVQRTEEEITQVIKRIAVLQLRVARVAAGKDDGMLQPGQPAVPELVTMEVDIDLSMLAQEEPAVATKLLSEPSQEPEVEVEPLPAPPPVHQQTRVADAPELSVISSPTHAAVGEAPPLALGQWVEITTPQRTVRTQLTWVSPQNHLFLFTAADASTQSMTRRMLDKLTAEGLVRKIGDQRGVARASTAERIDRRLN